MKKLAAFALALFMLALSGCGGGKDTEGPSSGGGSGIGGVLSGLRGGRELRMNVAADGDSVWLTAANTFQTLIEERTEGRYRVRIYTGEQDAAEGVEALFSGEIDLDLRSLMDLQGGEPRLAAAVMPWLFTSETVDETLFRGPGKESLFSVLRERGVEPLALGENGFLQFTNNLRPVSAPEDLRGLRVWVRSEGVEADFFRLMGAEPVVLGSTEGFAALQSGDLDGQENALDTIRAGDVHLIQRYLTVWDGSYDPICLCVSGKIWDELSETDRTVFRTAAQEACTAEIAAVRQLREELIGEFEESGVEVTVLSESQKDAFRSAVSPLYDTWRAPVGDALFADFGVVFS